MNLDLALQTYIVESRELLEDMENALLTLEHTEDREEAINSIFRAAHTIKGSAGMFSLDHIVAFTHGVESVLDKVRDGNIAVSDKLVVLMLACCDHIATLIAALESGQLEEDDNIRQHAAPLLAQLHVYLDEPAASASTVLSSSVQAPEYADLERIDHARGEQDHWHISLRFDSDVFRHGMDPVSFLRYLCKIGRIVSIVTVSEAVPGSDEMDPESCYLGFEIAFESDADKQEIENVFDFVQDDCRLRILPPHSRISEYVRLISELPEKMTLLGEILVTCGSLTARELDEALSSQTATSPDRKKPIGEIMLEQSMVPPAVLEAALAKQTTMQATKAQESQSIRVDADKLDRLINLVGELIIAGARTDAIARRVRNKELQESTSQLADLVEDVRDSALQLRMVKIGATFNRFKRVVHDVSREIGKDIALEVCGEDTELDKTVVEKIGDPLTHLVRNAIDHGIESAELRAARGKPEKGLVRLNAYHDSGNIVIEVGDDGGGLNRDRILAKAVERGLIEPGRELSDSEVYGLIFEPGFSTAEQVTNLSGRGVGMDVVKRNITALRGSVGIDSKEGIGTTVTVRLPLTLAIIDGFMVGLGKSVFVVPLDMIEECIEFSAEPGHDYTNLRGQVLPFIRLRELFDIEARTTRRQSIVVLKYAGQRAGLVVDTLLGEFQTVIKPLSKVFNHVNCISGSTILGNGEVALILDVSALLNHVAGKDMRQIAA